MKTLLRKVLVYLYALTWHATGYRPEAKPRLGAGHARHGDAKGSTMPEDATNLLNVFRGSYGRLCHLTCKALHDGAPTGLVQEAFDGGGSFGVPVLNAIRTRYVETNAALREAGKYYASPALTLAAYEVRVAHEQEWNVEIPKGVAA